MVIARFPVTYVPFNAEQAAGPVPIFFSEDPEETSKLLKDSPEFALSCLQALVSRLLAMEELTR